MLKELTPIQKQEIEKTLAAMTLEEKIGQIVCSRIIQFENKGPVEEYLKKYPLGAIYVGSEVIDTANMSAEEVKQQTERLMNTTKVPPVLVSDFEQGVGGQLDDDIFTGFPEAMAIAATGKPFNAYEVGRITALEAGSLNVHCTFGTDADLALNRNNPIIGIRSFGDDPDYVTPFIIEHIKGLQDHNCGACAKHFPGDGLDTRNQHYVTSFNNMDKEEWDRTCGKVWKKIIDAGVMTIMIGHLAMPKLEPRDPVTGKYRPATASKYILQDLLRGELGYKGLIISDALCMNGFYSWGDYDTRMLDALNAGIDLFLWPDTEKFFDCMLRAEKAGKLPHDRLDDAVRHMLEFKARVELIRKPCHIPDAKKIAGKIAKDALTLLHNSEKGIPLPRKKDAKYYVLTTPSHSRLAKVTAPFVEALSQYGEVKYSSLEEFDFNELDNADAVFLLNLGRTRFGDYRGMSGKIWPLTANEQIKNFIVVGMANPFFYYDVPNCDAYIAAYSAHPAAQKEAVKVIFGEGECRGKSPVSIEGYITANKEIDYSRSH